MKNKHTGKLRQRYKEASKKVEEIRNFYAHLAIYIPASLLLIVLAPYIIDYLEARGMTNPDVLKWVRLNILLMPVFWLVALLIHGGVAYWHHISPWLKGLKPGWLRRWEARQLQRYMEDTSKGSEV